MKNLHKIFIRIIVLSVFLVCTNYIYKYFFFETDIQKYSEVINIVRAVPDNAEIIYIGESSNITCSPDDTDRKSISDFISEYFPGIKMYDITKPAAHAGIYKVLLSKIPKESKVKTVIVTLNLRSFNAQWIFSKLETSLSESMVLLKDYPPLVNRFLLSFKAYDNKDEKQRESQFKSKWNSDILKFPYDFKYKTVTEWDAYLWKFGIKNQDSTKNDKLSDLACHYIKAFAFQIDTLTNPRIKDYDQIIELAKKRGWNLVFNLLSENVGKANELVGKDLIFLMKENRKLLVNYFEQKGVQVCDNLEAVEEEQFVDKDWTTEHYAEKGRKKIAKNVAYSLMKYYSGNYKEVKYTENYLSSFQNDCEGKIIWSQMQTLSREQKYSGEFSSKTGGGQDFGITFEYPFDKIQDTLKNIINIDMHIFMSSINKDAKLAIEAQGNEIKHFWIGINLDDQIKVSNKWCDFKYKFIVPQEIKNAGVIKVYVYNKSDKIVYADDIKIDFE